MIKNNVKWGNIKISNTQLESQERRESRKVDI